MLFLILASDVLVQAPHPHRLGPSRRQPPSDRGSREMIVDFSSPRSITIVNVTTPILLAATGELVVEKSGVLNLGVEGMMLLGAIAGFAVTFDTGNPHGDPAVARAAAPLAAARSPAASRCCSRVAGAVARLQSGRDRPRAGDLRHAASRR